MVKYLTKTKILLLLWSFDDAMVCYLQKSGDVEMYILIKFNCVWQMLYKEIAFV